MSLLWQNIWTKKRCKNFPEVVSRNLDGYNARYIKSRLIALDSDYSLDALKREFLYNWVQSHSALTNEELQPYKTWAATIDEVILDIEPDWHPRYLGAEYDKTGLPILAYIRWRASIFHYQHHRIEKRKDMRSKRNKSLKQIRSSML